MYVSGFILKDWGLSYTVIYDNTNLHEDFVVKPCH